MEVVGGHRSVLVLVGVVDNWSEQMWTLAGSWPTVHVSLSSSVSRARVRDTHLCLVSYVRSCSGEIQPSVTLVRQVSGPTLLMSSLLVGKMIHFAPQKTKQ